MLKQQILFTFLILNSAFIIAQQNLVVNPSFEDTVNCPNADDEMNYCLNWISYSASPDYFNACAPPSPGSDISVPYNFAGYQQAASGKAYAGFITYVSHTLYTPNYREYIGEMLSAPLAIGTKYYISFKVSMTIGSPTPSNCATDKIGAMFSTVPYDALAFNPAAITNNPKIHTNSIITDSLNWTRIVGAFIADSAYKYIAIGNFFDDAHTDTLIMDGSNTCEGAYYYLDDVCLSTDSIYAGNYNYTSISAYNTISAFMVYPNPSISGIFYTTTTFINEHIEVLDVLGNSLRQQYINGNIIDLSWLDNGIYIIEFNNQYQSKQKLIINK